VKPATDYSPTTASAGSGADKTAFCRARRTAVASSIELEYLQLIDEMKSKLADQGVRLGHKSHPMGQHKQPRMGHDHQERNMHS
jgi:hypothetical protein